MYVLCLNINQTSFLHKIQKNRVVSSQNPNKGSPAAGHSTKIFYLESRSIIWESYSSLNQPHSTLVLEAYKSHLTKLQFKKQREATKKFNTSLVIISGSITLKLEMLSATVKGKNAKKVKVLIM